MLTSATLRGTWYQKLYYLKLDMCVYLRAKFEVSSIILTSFRLGGEGEGVILTLPPTSRRTPKNATQIRVNKSKKILRNMDNNIHTTTKYCVLITQNLQVT